MKGWALGSGRRKGFAEASALRMWGARDSAFYKHELLVLGSRRGQSQEFPFLMRSRRWKWWKGKQNQVYPTPQSKGPANMGDSQAPSPQDRHYWHGDMMDTHTQ